MENIQITEGKLKIAAQALKAAIKEIDLLQALTHAKLPSAEGTKAILQSVIDLLED